MFACRMFACRMFACLHVCMFACCMLHSFLEYLRGGCELSLAVAVAQTPSSADASDASGGDERGRGWSRPPFWLMERIALVCDGDPSGLAWCATCKHARSSRPPLRVRAIGDRPLVVPSIARAAPRVTAPGLPDVSGRLGTRRRRVSRHRPRRGRPSGGSPRPAPARSAATSTAAQAAGTSTEAAPSSEAAVGGEGAVAKRPPPVLPSPATAVPVSGSPASAPSPGGAGAAPGAAPDPAMVSPSGFMKLSRSPSP